MLDLRFPLGWLFLVLGLALAAYGALGDQSIYRLSLDLNVNLWWGLVMLVFGAAMLVAAKLKSSG